MVLLPGATRTASSQVSSFGVNFQWQAKYLPHIKQIVGPLLLEEAPFELDTQEATDLLVLRARDMRIGCRMRRAGYAERYPWDFTLRSRASNGAKTELQKITEGWGDWLFYGHAEHDEIPCIARWMVIDLAHWRAHMIRNSDSILMGTRPNKHDGTKLAWFNASSFPRVPPILVASSHDLPVASSGVDGGALQQSTLPWDSAPA